MSLLVKARKSGRDIVSVTPQSAGWKYVGFAAHRLAAGESVERAGSDDEVCVVVLRGTVTVTAAEQRWRTIGKREGVFADEAPYAVYVPAGETIAVTAHGPAEVAFATAFAPQSRARKARVIDPSTMQRSTRGTGANTRYVCDILPQTEHFQ